MGLFDFSMDEMMSFFAVLVRFSVLVAVLPFVGDKVVPAPVKVLLALAVTIALFPALVASGEVQPAQAAIWGSTAGGIVGTVALEALCGLVLGYVAHLLFEAINFGGNLIGDFMGFAMAAEYDPNQEAQSQIVAQFQMAVAMLLFLAVDGHLIMLRASLSSYKIVGIGGLSGFIRSGMSGAFAHKLTELTALVIKFGLQLSAPIAVCMFAVNVAFGVLAKAMPQLNILVLSLAVSALVGLLVLILTIPEFQGAVKNIFSYMEDWMGTILMTMAKGH